MTAEFKNYKTNSFIEKLIIWLDLDTCFSISTNRGIISVATWFKMNIVTLITNDK